MEDLDALTTADVRSASLDELDDLCNHIVFILLCDLCDAIRPAFQKTKSELRPPHGLRRTQ